MVEKIPPPPPLSREYQQLNRWLLEIQSILNSSGSIDPGSVDGLPALVLQVNALAAQVAALALTVAGNTAAIAAANINITANANAIAATNINVAANTAAITALALRVTAVEARNQILNGAGVPAVGLGSNGDLYINNTGAAGTNLYAKRGGAWVAFA